MSAIRVSTFLMLLGAASLSAQSDQSPDVAVKSAAGEIPAIQGMGTGEMPEGQSPAERVTEPKLQMFSTRRTPVTQAFGTNGALNDVTGGILLEAFSSTPNLYLRSGTNDLNSTLTYLNFANEPIFVLRGDGLGRLRRDHAAETWFEVGNANTGSAGVYPSAGVRLAEGSTTKAIFKAVGSAATPYANNVFLWSYMNAPLVFGTNNLERMRINGDGTVAINYPGAYPARLTVQGGTDGHYGIFVTDQVTVESNTNQTDKAVVLQNQQNVQTGVTNAGGLYGIHSRTHSTGPGTTTNITGMLIEGGPTGGGIVHGMYGVAIDLSPDPPSGGSIGIGYGAYIADVEAASDYAFFQAGANDSNYFAGNVRIGGGASTDSTYALAVQGNANFVGTVTGTNIKAHYQDVAEWVPATADLAPGTVVILNPERSNEVMASSRAYDTTVAGVVSAQPGISLGVEGKGKEQVATTGRVRVRVDARAASVQIGDLLVTSDVPGTAMLSQPMEINGRKFHQPGTIIGKALEPLAGGIGEILVLLSMQ